MAQHKYSEQHRKQVRQWAAVGLPLASIGVLLGEAMGLKKPLDAHVISRQFKAELEAGVASANAGVAGSLYSRAMGGSVDACRYWLDRRGGDAWKAQQQAIDLTTAGKPIEAASPISREELDAAIKRARDAV